MLGVDLLLPQNSLALAYDPNLLKTTCPKCELCEEKNAVPFFTHICCWQSNIPKFAGFMSMFFCIKPCKIRMCVASPRFSKPDAAQISLLQSSSKSLVEPQLRKPCKPFMHLRCHSTWQAGKSRHGGLQRTSKYPLVN